MNLFRNTNSWHWLLMAMAGSLLVVAYPTRLVWKKIAKENDPLLQGMQARADELKLLDEEDVFVHEHQAAEIQKRIDAYETAVREKAGQPIPEGVQSVGVLGSEISRALLKYRLRVVVQEQAEVPEPAKPVATATTTTAASVPPEVAEALAAQAAATEAAAQGGPGLPFETREIRYVVEGEYKYMFMFLVAQSRLKPSYHFKDIKISPAAGETGMRMEFTVQIHFT